MANQADFAPTLGALKDLRPFVFWAQTTLPTVFDDSLSYYEVLTKLCKMVNTMLENEDTNAENIEALATAYQELQDFTNNYFENLDVTQEINDKLDALVADGTIPNLVLNRADTILNTYLYGEDGESGVNKDIEDLIADANADIALALSNFATNSNQAISQFELNGRGAIDQFNSDADGALDGVPDLIEDWMDDHFTNPSSVVIDDTLTVSGAAADAYATGKLMDDAENMVLATAYWQNYMIDALSQYYILADNNGGSNPTVGQGAQYKVMHIANVTAGETYLVSGVASSFSGTRYVPAYALGSVTYDTGGNPYYEFYDVYPRGWDTGSDPGAVYQYVRNQSVRIPTGTSPTVTHLFIMSDSRIPVTARCSRLNVRTDDTLTSESLPAQGKATGDAVNTKLPWPVENSARDTGANGDVLLSNGDGTTRWGTAGDYGEAIEELQNDTSDLKNALDGVSARSGVLSGTVNYDYDTYVNIPEVVGSSSNLQKIGIRREYSQIALNNQSAPTSVVRIKISGDVVKASNNSAVDAWSTGISLKPGHIYRIVTKLTSGTVNVPDGVNPPYFTVFSAGNHVGLGKLTRDRYNSSYEFVAPNDEVNLAVAIQANTTTSEAVYQVILLDKSEIIGEDVGIPRTYPVEQPSNSGQIVVPNVIHSEEMINYNCNIDGIKRAATQGICSDGIRYLFFPARQYAGDDADDEVPVMVKWDTVTNAPVVVNGAAPKSYGHVEDMCFVPASVPGIDNGNVDRLYLTDMNRSTAAGYTGAVHVVDANTLEFITTVQTYDQNDNSKNLVSTALAPYWHGVYHLGYSPERELFFVHSGGLSSVDPDNRLNQTIAILDKNGSVIKGLKFVRSEGTIYSCDCDANYIYIGIYSGTEESGVFDIRLAVFDWDLNPVTSVNIDQKTWEIEGACHIGNIFYFSWILPAGNARTGCYVTKQTYEKNYYFDRNTSFPVNWVENLFHVSSFQPFTA